VGPERRRRWAAAEKIAIVAETYESGVTVSLVARRHGVAPNQVFSWRRLAAQGALTAAGSGEEVVPASDYCAVPNPASRDAALARQEDDGGRDPERGFGARERSKKTSRARALAAQGRYPMKAVCEALGVSRSNLAAGLKAPIAKPLKRVGRAPKPDDELVNAIKAIIGAQPTYGYRRVWGMLRREATIKGHSPVNAKRVHRVMRAHGMLLQRHAGGVDARRHDGKIAVERSNLRWCFDGFELACDNGEKVRVAFALDCCDREAMAWVAATQGIKSEDVRDLMVASLESRFGQVNRLPRAIEWLSDNGSGYIAKDTKRFARDLGFVPLTTPVASPQSNGMAEAFVRTIKRDYARVNPAPDAQTVIESLPI
jgi:putative transposase